MTSPLWKILIISACLLVISAGALAAQGTPGAPWGQGPEKAMSARVQQLLDHRTVGVRDDGSQTLQRARVGGERAPDALNAIVLMCDFSDSLLLGRHGLVPGDFPDPMQSEIYYDAHDSVFFDHLFTDVADYYYDVSDGDFSFNFTIHNRVINLPHPMGYYGNHPEEGEQPIVLAADVVDSLDAEIDFSLYDTFILVHAGAGEETDIKGDSPEQIYSNYLDAADFQAAHDDSLLDNPWLPSEDFGPDDGIKNVLILPECEYQDPIGGFGGYFGSLGVYCFEVGLRLGMLSLSDFTPGGRPDSQGIGEFGLMGYGLFVGMGWIPPHPCAYNKMLMGWLEPVEMNAMVGGAAVLTPCENTGDEQAALRVSITGQEFWLVAYRLQDPDGNRIFSFPGDLNGNNIPDFYDFDSPWDGIPVGKFDPETDTRERLAGSEWDFFMSENSARLPGIKGAGSGLYIWHVDEGVIQDVFGMSGNLFNANAERKSVDLEEADGIQDLDSREPSAYILGGDDDSFRGEDNGLFGPHSRPDTRSAGGAETQVVFENISHVVLDSTSFVVAIDTEVTPPDTLWGLVYADSMTMDVTIAADGAAPVMTARRELPAGMDLRGSHVLLADLGGPDDLDEIILAGSQGEVLVFDGDLNEFVDPDGDPATVVPFAVGTYDGIPVNWNQPAAVGDIDADGNPEVVLGGPHGLYAFDADGNALLPDGTNHGLWQEVPQSELPPVLIPRNREADYAADEAVDVCVVVVEAGSTHLKLYSGVPASPGLDFNLGAVRILSPPVYGWQHLAVAVWDTVENEGKLLFCDVGADQVPGSESITASYDLELYPGNFSILLGLVDPSAGLESQRYAVVPAMGGRAQTLFFDTSLNQVGLASVWPNEIKVRSPLAPGGAFVGDDVFGRVGHNAVWQDGWPSRPRDEFSTQPDSCCAGPLVGSLLSAGTPIRQFLFPVSDGRIFGRGMKGEEFDGWPLPGPARSAGTPAFGRVNGADNLDLVATGTFARITGLAEDGEDLLSTDISSLSVWSEVASPDALWPMWGASPWRNGNWEMTAWSGPPVTADGDGLVPGSHYCYPSPLGEQPLTVRGQVRSAGRVRAHVYNLEGEEISATGWQDVVAEDPFALSIELDTIVSGMYLCRLVVETASGGTDHSVVSFAVVR